MDISPTNSALNLINGAQHKSAEAAHKIATLPIKNDEVGSSEFEPRDIIKPVLSLKEAEFETSAAVKILETEKKTLGSLLDIKA
ncbi:MAG TPA: hypothetical protein DCZ48_12920 [Methylococcaceae bacterium]|nr:hypothetical protein [Methylococcaceae bacterium]